MSNVIDDVVVPVGGTSIILLLVLLLTYPWWRFAFFAFFTRIVPPKALDQETRARIFQFVERENGVRAQHIVKKLGLATGQTMHHLYILGKQGLVTRTGAPFAKRYFVKGRLSPTEMQKQAALQNEGMANLFAAIQRNPGATISEHAKHLGVSVARVSRMAKQLEDAKLIQRRTEGRTVRIYPGQS